MSIDFHEYFPYDSGLGANSTETRWRKMAQVWETGGVVFGLGHSFVGDACTIQPGAVWVGGNYGEITEAVTIGVPAAATWVVARNDTVASKIEITTVPGTSTNPPVDTPTIFYQPILNRSGGSVFDMRRFVDRHPRGLLAYVQSSGQTSIPGNGQPVDLAGMSASFRLTEGNRRIRIVAESGYYKAGGVTAGNAVIYIRRSDNSEIIRRYSHLGANFEQLLHAEIILSFAAGQHTVKVSGSSAQGDLVTSQNAQAPGILSVEDVGRF